MAWTLALGTGEARAEPAEAHLTGVPISHEGSAHHVFVTGLGTITCETTEFTGIARDGDEALTVSPSYEDCVTLVPFSGEFPTTVAPNGCDYALTGGQAKEGEPDHFEEVTSSLVCPEEATGIAITVWNDEAHTEKRCEYVVHPFEHKAHGTVLNNAGAAKDLQITSELTDVAVSRVSGTFFQCGSQNTTSDYTGATTLRAYADEGHTEQVDLALTEGAAEAGPHLEVG